MTPRRREKGCLDTEQPQSVLHFHSNDTPASFTNKIGAIKSKRASLNIPCEGKFNVNIAVEGNYKPGDYTYPPPWIQNTTGMFAPGLIFPET